MIRAGFAVFAVGAVVLIAMLLNSQSERDRMRRAVARQRESANYRPASIIPPVPALLRPNAVRAAAISGFDDNELVIGLQINGEARAYPVNFINDPEHEVINDDLGDVPIAVTWCDHCSNSVVFERRVDGKPLTLSVAGMLWRDNMVMRDETGTEWSQLLGRAMKGIRKGRSLRVIPSTLTSWKSWKQRYPRTTVVVLPRTSYEYSREYLDSRGDLYFAISRNGESRAWKMTALTKAVVVNDRLPPESGQEKASVPLVVVCLKDEGTVAIRGRKPGSRVLTFERNRGGEIVDRETGSVWDMLTGKAVSGKLAGSTLPLLPGTLVTRAAWQRFRPESTYWGTDPPTPHQPPGASPRFR